VKANAYAYNHYIDEAVARLVRSLDRVEAIVLFGSRARGDWTPWSDYDILIVAQFNERYLDRIARILELLSDIPLEIEPHPYTLEESIHMLLKGNPTLVDAMEEGIVLYEGPGFKIMLETYMDLKKKGLTRTETSIVLPPLRDH